MGYIRQFLRRAIGITRIHGELDKMHNEIAKLQGYKDKLDRAEGVLLDFGLGSNAGVQPLEYAVLLDTIERARSMGYENICLIYRELHYLSDRQISKIAAKGVKGIIALSPKGPTDNITQLPVYGSDKFGEIPESVDICISYDPILDGVYRKISSSRQFYEMFYGRNLPVVPYNFKQVLNDPGMFDCNLEYAASKSAVTGHYVYTNKLEGNYAEFGCWFGRSFYENFFRFREMLKGDFYAFDSFGGLPKGMEAEASNTRGDFVENAYFCNLASFLAIGRLLGVDMGRVKTVKGFYGETLVGKTPADYGIAPRSLSVCYIDCDIYESTIQVLEFVSGALEDGCLIYFDNLRMNRASLVSGERGALLKWLRDNPSFDLMELPSPQSRFDFTTQWYIFNRK